MLRDINDKVGNEVIEGVIGQHGVPGRNESGGRLLELCAEQELEVGNSWLRTNYVDHSPSFLDANSSRQGINGLCVVTKANAWKSIRYEFV